MKYLNLRPSNHLPTFVFRGEGNQEKQLLVVVESELAARDVRGDVFVEMADLDKDVVETPGGMERWGKGYLNHLTLGYFYKEFGNADEIRSNLFGSKTENPKKEEAIDSETNRWGGVDV